MREAARNFSTVAPPILNGGRFHETHVMQRSPCTTDKASAELFKKIERFFARSTAVRIGCDQTGSQLRSSRRNHFQEAINASARSKGRRLPSGLNDTVELRNRSQGIPLTVGE